MKLFKIVFDVQMPNGRNVEDAMYVVEEESGAALTAAEHLADKMGAAAVAKVISEVPKGAILFQVGVEMVPKQPEDQLPLVTLVGDGGRGVN